MDSRAPGFPGESPQELGYPFPEAQRPESGLPPGGGRWTVPHFQSFTSLVNAATRIYRWQFDEALRQSHKNALAWRRDPVVFEALRARQMPTAQLAWHLEPQDEDDEEQQAAV